MIAEDFSLPISITERRMRQKIKTGRPDDH
jgi:hypothetical protein